MKQIQKNQKTRNILKFRENITTSYSFRQYSEIFIPTSGINYRTEDSLSFERARPSLEKELVALPVHWIQQKFQS